jgi:hypothetical protein
MVHAAVVIAAVMDWFAADPQRCPRLHSLITRRRFILPLPPEGMHPPIADPALVILTLLVNSKTRGNTAVHTTFERPSDEGYASGEAYS